MTVHGQPVAYSFDMKNKMNIIKRRMLGNFDRSDAEQQFVFFGDRSLLIQLWLCSD